VVDEHARVECDRIAPLGLPLMNRLALFGAVLGALALGVLSSVFVVDQRQFAVVYALGEIRRVIDTPGLHLKLPPPFQNIVYFDKRILTIDTPDTDRFITSEKLNLQVDSYVKWRIVDVKVFIRSASGSQNIATDRLLRSLRDAMNIEISKITVAELISGEREKIVEELRIKLNEAAREIGAEIVDVRLKRVDFAPEVADRVFERMQSERKRVANERRATGGAESEKIRADAERQRDVILAEAYRDAQRLKGQGDARAASLYAEAFGQNPEFAAYYRSLQAYRESFQNKRDVIVIDPSSEFFRYFKAPGTNAAKAPR
jgi:membrane protease subunit HflC